MSTPSVEEAVEKARRATDDRIESVKVLAESRQQLSDAREQAERLVRDAENADVKAYNAALSAGWTEQELKKIGLSEPDKKRRTKRRSTARTASTKTTEVNRPSSGDASPSNSGSEAPSPSAPTS